MDAATAYHEQHLTCQGKEGGLCRGWEPALFGKLLSSHQAAGRGARGAGLRLQLQPRHATAQHGDEIRIGARHHNRWSPLPVRRGCTHASVQSSEWGSADHARVAMLCCS